MIPLEQIRSRDSMVCKINKLDTVKHGLNKIMLVSICFKNSLNCFKYRRSSGFLTIFNLPGVHCVHFSCFVNVTDIYIFCFSTVLSLYYFTLHLYIYS